MRIGLAAESMMTDAENLVRTTKEGHRKVCTYRNLNVTPRIQVMYSKFWDPLLDKKECCVDTLNIDDLALENDD